MKLTQRPTARTLPHRTTPASAIVVHATGQTDPRKTIAWYTAADGLGPHALVAEDGEILQFAPFDRVAWHAAYGRAELEAYARGWDWWSRLVPSAGGYAPRAAADRYAEWRERWPDADSPTAILGLKPNFCSIGVELQSLSRPTAALFSDAQYAALSAFLAWAGQSASSGSIVVGHSDVDPLTRWNQRGSADPGARFDWRRALKGTPWEG